MIQFIKTRFTQTQLIAIGYFLVIGTGALLLMLPVSSRAGVVTDPLSAVFTATSATCVTGLIVVDTASYWSLFGQIVILMMIQVGGLGFMTIGVLFAMFLNKRITLSTRGILQESMNTTQVGGVVRLVKKTLIGTALIEGTGAFLLAFRFVPQFGWGRGVYFSVFHSISAFCNAGFDLMGRVIGPYDSLCSYSDDILVNAVIMLLIVIGGIGFFVWDDVTRNGIHIRKYKLHTKIALSFTAILIFGGAFCIWIFERGNLMAGMPLKETILTSLFSSVTARTAGFNTIDTGALTISSKMFTSLLMFIGGSPGSTAGGIKTTTMVVLLIYVWSNLRGARGCNIFGRRMEDDAVKKASNVAVVSLILAILASIVIPYLQPGMKMEDVVFEVFSAIGTVGMSTGITRDLTHASRIIIILLMYCGRIGSMSFALSFMERKRVAPIQLPEEKVMIG